jgi:hypothetical protein
MPALWHLGQDGWRALAPTGYPAEKVLHDLVEATPDLLPLSAAERLTIVGREVQLGNGFADLIAIEPSGRVAVIEIKLSSNSEAKRAVVAQVLSYAAFLHGRNRDAFQQDLAIHLTRRGYDDIAAAVEAGDQEGSFLPDDFYEGLSESLSTGRFRLVIVLDDAPPDLIRLVGYLESATEHLLIDLITVAAFDADGQSLLVPQRVDPGHPTAAPMSPARVPSKPHGLLAEGSTDFRAAIARAPAAARERLETLCSWAEALAEQGLVTLQTYHGQRGLVLLPRLRDERVGLATVWELGGGTISVWRKVFERRAPRSLEALERLIDPVQVKQGNTLPAVNPEVLAALTDAYREAVGQPPSAPNRGAMTAVDRPDGP